MGVEPTGRAAREVRGRGHVAGIASASAEDGGTALDEGAAAFVEVGGGGAGDEGFAFQVQPGGERDVGTLAYGLLGGGERERRVTGDLLRQPQRRRLSL